VRRGGVRAEPRERAGDRGHAEGKWAGGEKVETVGEDAGGC